jgi:class 3 adenylate cyclase/tetratricopeptide (TPR) repeat protein
VRLKQLDEFERAGSVAGSRAEGSNRERSPRSPRDADPDAHTWGVERKLAAVLFVDLVGSTALVAGSDPEVVRRRVTQFFDLVSGSIAAYGGTVEKFAGDAVMAAFGIPRAHEDDAERALRAALEIRAAVSELGLECRLGIDAGEIVTGGLDSTFATGQAVNAAARLEQLAEPNEILVGPGAHRLALHAVEFESVGRRSLDGFAEPVEVWRAVAAARRDGRPVGALSVPLVGRGAELELLRNTFERTVRDGRPHLVTIYGEPGVGKSRLVREFLAGLEGPTVLTGRSLPYGEGITYWPLAEMVKTWAGIADDDPAGEAREKLVSFCEDEAVADLLALTVGVLEAVETDRSQQEIAWAAGEWAEQLAAAQPLVLAFEDIHWAEEPLLRLIKHLASPVRDAPLLILCLARPELLEVFPGWGGGRVRGGTLELGALARDEAEQLVDALVADLALPRDVRLDVLDKTEGNPLFLEETVRMLAEGSDGQVPIPDSVQALIAARIDGLPRAAKLVLQHASVIGRVFWRSALTKVSEQVEDVDGVLEELLRRDFLLPEARSSITGEDAFRFKHILIREIAYAGIAKSDRAELHAAFAAWLHGRGVEELVEIRAYHLDRAVTLLGELDGTAPESLVRETASALEAAGLRVLAREANRSARNLLVRAVELEPTLERRYQAARAAWRLDDIPAVAVEMERVRADAHEAGDRRLEGRALIALGEVTVFRDSDSPGSRQLIEDGLALLETDDFIGRFDALRQLSSLARWTGDRAGSRRYAKQALDAACAVGRKDLMSWASNELANAFLWAFELDAAEELANDAARLADESGGIVSRGRALHTLAHVAEVRGDPDEAARLYEDAMGLFVEAGAALDQGRNLNHQAELVMGRGDYDRAQRLAREAVRMLEPLGDRGYLCESQRILAETLVRQGKLAEAERYALAAVETVGPQDVTSLSTTRMALGLVRAAQGRDDEAEALLREAVDRSDLAPGWIQALTARRLAEFLESRGRHAEAAGLDARMKIPAHAR